MDIYLVQVKSNAEREHAGINFDLHKATTWLKDLCFVLFLSGCLRQVSL